jgi:hypothetical protein
MGTYALAKLPLPPTLWGSRCAPVTGVTAIGAIHRYLGLIAKTRLSFDPGSTTMTKFYSRIAAAAVLFPAAFAVTNQAAMIVA